VRHSLTFKQSAAGRGLQSNRTGNGRKISGLPSRWPKRLSHAPSGFETSARAAFGEHTLRGFVCAQTLDGGNPFASVHIEACASNQFNERARGRPRGLFRA
jgi:hypothetical protein